jgi:hypothetical protein
MSASLQMIHTKITSEDFLKDFNNLAHHDVKTTQIALCKLLKGGIVELQLTEKNSIYQVLSIQKTGEIDITYGKTHIFDSLEDLQKCVFSVLDKKHSLSRSDRRRHSDSANYENSFNPMCSR